MLVSSKSLFSGYLKQLGKSMQAIADGLCAHAAILIMQILELPGQIMIIPALSFEMHLPSIAADRHLHNFRGPFIDSGNAYIASDFFNHVFARVAVASQCLD